MAKNKAKEERELSELEKLRKGETRNLDQLPEWKRREIERLQANEDRIEQEQNEKDFNQGRGAYHPDAIALAQTQAAARVQQPSGGGAALARLIDQYESSQYEIPVPKTPTSIYAPPMTSGELAPEKFWESEGFIEVVKAIQSNGGKKVAATYVPVTVDVQDIRQPNNGQVNIPTVNVFDGQGAGAGSGSNSVLPATSRLNPRGLSITSTIKDKREPKKNHVPPSYLMTLYGPEGPGSAPMPFFQGDVSTYESIVASTKDSPNYLVREGLPMLFAGFKIGNMEVGLGGLIDAMYAGVDVNVGGQAIKGLTFGGMFEEEWVYQENPNGPQAAIQAAFNLGALGFESLRYFFTASKAMNATPEYVSEDKTPGQDFLDTQLRLEEYRLGEAVEAFTRAWQTGTEAWKDAEVLPENNPYLSQEDRTQLRMDRELKAQMERTSAQMQSEDFSLAASETYQRAVDNFTPGPEQAQEFKKAIDLGVLSIESRRRADPLDNWGAATWQREPERYAAFLENAAALELQLGRPLDTIEIRRLKDMYTNVNTELTFQLVFDLTNVLPAISQLTQVSSAFPIIGKIKGAVTGGVSKVADYLPVIRFFKQPAVNKITAQIAANMDNLTRGMMGAYRSVPELAGALKRLEPLLADFRTAVTLEERQIVFQKARALIPGVAQWDFSDFKKFSDSYNPALGTTSLADEFSTSQKSVQQAVYDVAKKNNPTWSDSRLERYATKIAQSPQYVEMTSRIFGNKMSEAYSAAHRIFDNSALYDDTLIGQMVKKFALLTSTAPRSVIKKINPKVIYGGAEVLEGNTLRSLIVKSIEHPSSPLKGMQGTKLHKLVKDWKTWDELMVQWGMGLTDKSADFLNLTMVDGLEYVARVGAAMRQVWIGLVLTTPRFVITNLIDSMGRGFIYGESIYDDLSTLIFSTQRHFGDGASPIGVPRQMSSSLARTEVEMLDEVSIRLMYEHPDKLPGANPFSFLAREHSRRYGALRQKRISPTLVGLSDDMQKKFIRRVGDSASSSIQKAWDWLKVIPGTMQGASADFNSAIEFTLRSRMFHRSYMKSMADLERRALADLVDNADEYSPFMKDLMVRVYRESGGSPAKMKGLVEALTRVSGKETKDVNQFYSWILPAKWMDGSEMEPERIQVFTHTVRENAEKFMADIFEKTGNVPTPEDWDKFLVDFQENMQNSYQEVVSVRGKEFKQSSMDDSIDPMKRGQAAPNHRDLKGTNPANMESRITEALGVIKSKGGRGKFNPEKIQESYKTVLSNVAEVVDAEGTAARATISNGKIKLSIGADFWLQPREQLYVGLRDATLDVIALRNSEFLSTLDMSRNQFKAVALEFMEDATAVLARDERAFVVMMDEMDENPILRELLAATNKAGVDRYEGAKQLYYQSLGSKYASELFGADEQDIRAILRKKSDDMSAPDLERRKAGVEKKAAVIEAVKLGELSNDPAFRDTLHIFQNAQETSHSTLQEFGRLVWPGPGIQRRGGELRGSKWDVWEKLMAKAYEAERDMLKEISYNVNTLGYDAGRKYMEETLANYNEEFLRRVGFEVIWKDDAKTELFQIKNRFGGRFTVMSDGGDDFLYIKQNFFGNKKATGSSIDLTTAGTFNAKGVIVSKIRAATGISYDQAVAWTSMMEKHASRWMDITGGSLQEYFERFSLQVGDNVSYLTRTPEGGYRFVTDASGDLPSFLKQTSQVLFDDMNELAKLDPDVADELAVITKTIEDSTLRKSILLKYIDMDDAQRVTARTSMLEKLGDVKFNEVWNGITKVLDGKKGMTPELVAELGKFQAKYGFTEEDMLKLMASSYPTVSKADIKRYVESVNITRTMDASEYNEVFSELFMEYLQTGWAPPGMPKAFNKFKEWLAADFDVLKRMQFDMADEVHDAMSSIFVEAAIAPTSTDEMMETLKDIARSQGLDPDALIKEARAARKAARMSSVKPGPGEGVAPVPGGNFPAAEAKAVMPKNFAELTTDDLERMTYAKLGEGRTAPAETLSKEIDEVWKVYLQGRTHLRQFPIEARTSPWVFRRYAKEMADSLPPAAAESYLRAIADVDNLIRKVANVPAPFPAVAEFQVNSGVKTFLKSSEQLLGDFEEMKRALASLRTHLTNGGNAVPVLDDASKQQLLTWLPEAMDTKAKTVSVATNGGVFQGRDYNGAIKRVNDIMLDYTDQSRFDNIMRNLFPFWMFPSRSIPFWMKTAATHPEIISFYNKMKRYSEASRMQAGAVTSDGRPLDSLDGYMPIPGTDIWVNPLAPLSFRYVLGVPELIEEIGRSAGYESSQQEDDDPMIWTLRKIMEIGPMVGFNMAPWTAWGIKEAAGLPDSILPKFPAAPFISLIPRWFLYDTIQKADKIAFGDFKLGQFLYPEADFQEANVERRMYQNALEEMQIPGANKALIIENIKTALVERQGNALWDETYKELTNQNALQSIGSFFTGFYAKPFSDSQAELYALRNELNLMKSTMNNEFQASIFKLDGDADARWARYLKAQDIEENQLYRLYVQSGWVRDESNSLVSDPAERAKYLKEAIEAEQKQQAYYNGMEVARKRLDNTLKELPIGASYDVVSKEYDRYYEQVNKLREANEFAYDRSFGSRKPVELIQGEIRDEFYYVLLSTRPRWNENTPYDEYQRRIAAWEQTLPMMSPDVMRSFLQRNDIAATLSSLHEDQVIATSFWTSLNKESQTIEGIRRWQLEQDDLFDALNNAWSELYWRPYWENAQGLDTTERDLYDYDFGQNNPPPTAEQMYAWIRETYGTKFSIDDVRKWVNGTEVLDVEKRLVQQRTQEQMLRNQIWDYMSWIGPSKDLEMIQYLELAIYEKIGDDKQLDGDILQDMMDRNNDLFRGDPKALQRLIKVIEEVYREKRVREPTRIEMVQYVKAQDSNEQFKKLVNQEFGDISPDWEKTGVTPYDILQKYQKEFFFVERSKSYTYKYKAAHPEEYELLQEYWDRKRSYGRTDPVWNMYYNMSEDKKNIPTQFTGIFGLDEDAGSSFQYPGTLPNTSGSLYSQPAVSGGSNPSKRSPTQPSSDVRLPAGSGTTIAAPITPSLKRAMGNLLAWEVQIMMTQGRPLTKAAVEYFVRLRERHPEWKQEIDNILIMNPVPAKTQDAGKKKTTKKTPK